ncbi:MAG TPA: HAD-IA family hydrolase [Solirubrobacteraceae bacterium]|jgi:putative hydrolase of the HAD superfamily|nr:HAD-IA family hydrolase [Solirubrobacteraceae bacterium]
MVVCLDALGTLVELLAPAPALVEQLRARGMQVSERQATAALREEIAFYRAQHDSAADAASLALLRERCTEILRDGLARAGAQVAAVSHELLRDALLAALRFRAYPEVPDALRALRRAGHRLVVVSNWDVSLHDALRDTGLATLVDGAISSAEAGAAKPDPRIFARALALAGAGTGAGASGGLHAGDSLEHDVAGARAAGLRPVLVVRAGRPPPVPDGVAVIGSLAELAALAAQGFVRGGWRA